MNKHRELWNAALKGAVSGLALAIAVPAWAQDQGDNAESPESMVGDIVVTAQKREQSLQDVPIAISAFSGDQMSNLGVDSSADIAAIVPNVQIGQTNGQASQPLIYIRGVGLSDFNSNNAGPNGVYVDEVYVSAPNAQAFQIFDLERVEVLKGPQGTLYGRNATGGAINFISRKPTDELSGHLKASYGSFDTIEGEAAIGGPLAEGVAARIAGTFTRSNGYVHNLLTGRRENGAGSFALRGLLKVDFSDNLDALFSLQYGRVSVRAPQFRTIGLSDPATGAPCTTSAILAEGCANPLGYVTPPGYYDGEYDRSDRLKINNRGASARFNWKLGDVTLTSISAYAHNDKFHPEETDGSPLDILNVDYKVRSNTYTQELRLSGDSDSLNWVIGGYYLTEVLHQNQTVDVFRELRGLTPGGGGDPTGATTGGAPVLFARIVNRQKTDALAAFGQLEYKLTPELRVTLGARYNYEKKNFRATSQFEDEIFGGVPIPGGVIPLYDFNNRASFKNISFKAGLDYDIANDIMVYASVSTGFKSGGFNGGFLSFDPAAAAIQAQPYEEETLTDYEAGIKSTLFDGRVRFNASAFYYDYKDLQLFTLISTSTIPLSLLDNAANASIYGAEFELVAKPVDNLDITLNVGLLDTEVKNFTSAGSDFSGNRLASSPKLTMSGLINYEIPLSSSGLVVALQPSFSYRSQQYFSVDNDPLLSQKGYWLVGARIALKPDGDRWEAAAFVRNLTGKKYKNYAVDLSDFGFNQYNRGEPRMFGVELMYKY